MSKLKTSALGAVMGAICALSLAAPANSADKSLKIGVILPYSGVFSQLARDLEDGWRLALDERSATIADYEVVLITEDGEGTAQVALQKAQKLIKSDGVEVIAGVVSSAAAIALAGVAEKEKIPFIAANAVADELTGQYCNPYVARTSFSANALQSAAGHYWAEAGYKTAVTMADDYSAGRAMIAGFARGFEGAGGKILLQEFTPLGQTTDWGPSLMKARQLDADFIYTFYTGTEAVQIVKQHAAFGLKGIPLLGAVWLYDEALWPAMESDLIGAHDITVYTHQLETEASKRFKTAFKEKYGRLPGASNAMGYDNGVATLEGLARAIESNGGKVPDDGIAVIKEMTALTLDSPRGPLHFNASNNAVVDNLYVVEIVDGGNGPEQRLLTAIPYGEDLPGCNMQ